MSTRILYVYVKYSMCDLMTSLISFMTSSVAVFQAAIWVKSMYVMKSCLKTKKKRIIETNYFLHKSPLKDRLGMEFTAY